MRKINRKGENDDRGAYSYIYAKVASLCLVGRINYWNDFPHFSVISFLPYVRSIALSVLKLNGEEKFFFCVLLGVYARAPADGNTSLCAV